MRLPQNRLQRLKSMVHATQGVLVCVAGILTLAVMTKSGGFGGATSFYFALCFFTLPALAYLCIGPMWSRMWRLNNVYAYAAIDVLLCLLWFAAAIAVAVWNTNGISKGEKDDTAKTKRDMDTLFRRADTTKKGCAAFAYGSAAKCNVSKATVGFGVVIFFLFIATSYLSIRAVLEFRKTGFQPNTAFSGTQGRKEELGTEAGSQAEDPKDVFTDDLNSYGDHVPSAQDYQGLLSHQHSSESLAHPGRRTSSIYSSQVATAPAMYDQNYAPSALSPTGVLGAHVPADTSGRVTFPEANYAALR